MSWTQPVIRACGMCQQEKRILARGACAGCYQAMRRAGLLERLTASPRGWKRGVRRQGLRGKAVAS